MEGIITALKRKRTPDKRWRLSGIICTSFFDIQIFYLCFERGLCAFRFHPITEYFPTTSITGSQHN